MMLMLPQEQSIVVARNNLLSLFVCFLKEFFTFLMPKYQCPMGDISLMFSKGSHSTESILGREVE